MPTNKKRYTINLDDEIAAKIKKLAEAEDRPVAYYITKLIETSIVEEQQAKYQGRKTNPSKGLTATSILLR